LPTASARPHCTRDFEIKVYVKHVSGAKLIVHKQGTITAVIPPAPAVMMSQPVGVVAHGMRSFHDRPAGEVESDAVSGRI
jgi:hypothetical protein